MSAPRRRRGPGTFGGRLPRMPRRTFLRGAGTVAIGLPLLEPMLGRRALGAPPPPPVRCLTLFHGLGVPKAMQGEGFDGPLGPLAPFAERLAIFRNVDMSEAGGAGHARGGTCVFVGAPGRSDERSGGPSIDQVLRAACYPEGVPTPLGTLAAGTFFRRAHGLYQRIRCWGEAGERVVEPFESPVALFRSLFGMLPEELGGGAIGSDGDSPEAARRRRLDRSVLDVVLDEYRHYGSEASNLDLATRRRIRDHLDHLRSLERRVFEGGTVGADAPWTPGARCRLPSSPPDEPPLPYGRSGPADYEAVRVDAGDFAAAFRLLAELVGLALRCDLVRFASLMCESAGGHTALAGVHEPAGAAPYVFRGETAAHTNFHEGRLDHMRGTARFFQSQLAAALAVLDDPEGLEPNGGTLLDNTLVVMGTEVGTNHDMNGVFHAVAGGAGRLRLGDGCFWDRRVQAVDLYNTLVRAYGVERRIGSREHFGGVLPGLLA